MNSAERDVYAANDIAVYYLKMLTTDGDAFWSVMLEDALIELKAAKERAARADTPLVTKAKELGVYRDPEMAVWDDIQSLWQLLDTAVSIMSYNEIECVGLVKKIVDQARESSDRRKYL